MIKTILVAKSFQHEDFDDSSPYIFNNGEYVPNNYGHYCFWIKCTLPAVPPSKSVIALESIDKQDMLNQMTEIYKANVGFRNFMRKFRDNNFATIGDITIEDALKHFCGLDDKVVDVYSGVWTVENVSFRPNDEYVYVEIRNDL